MGVCLLWASLVALMVKNPPAMWETWARSLGWDDPLEEGIATHSGILAWRIPWTEEPGRLQSMGSQRVRWLSEIHTLQHTHTHTHTHRVALQYCIVPAMQESELVLRMSDWTELNWTECMSLYFFRFPSHWGHHRALCRIPYGIQ